MVKLLALKSIPSYRGGEGKVFPPVKAGEEFDTDELEAGWLVRARLAYMIRPPTTQQDTPPPSPMLHKDELIAERERARDEQETDGGQQLMLQLEPPQESQPPPQEVKTPAEGSLLAQKIPSFGAFFDFISLLLGKEADYTKAAIITGSAGIGKTRHVLAALARADAPYELYNSYSTPLALYEILYRTNGRVLVLDDVNQLLHDKKSVAILKAACFNAGGERVITYSSTTKVLEDRGLPAQFTYTGRIIIILNEIPATLRETFQALLNRVYHHEIRLTMEEKRALVRHVFQEDIFGLSDADKGRLLTMLEEVVDFSNLHKFNVRSALRAAEIYKALGPERAQELIYDLLDTDMRLRVFLLIEKHGGEMPVEQRVAAYVKSTGYSRRDYFLVKSRYYAQKYGRRVQLEREEQEVKSLFGIGGMKR